MPLERVLWWIVLAWTFRYAWRSYAKAEAAGKADTSGTQLLERGASKLEEMIRFAGDENRVGEGSAVASWTVDVAIRGNRYRVTMERRVWERG